MKTNKHQVMTAGRLGLLVPILIQVMIVSGCATEPCTQYEYRTVTEQVCARRSNTGHCAHYTSRTKTKKVCVARAGGAPPKEVKRQPTGREKWERFSAEARQLSKQQAQTPTGWLNGIWAKKIENCKTGKKLKAIKIVKSLGKMYVQTAQSGYGPYSHKNRVTWNGDKFTTKISDRTFYHRKISDRHYQVYASVGKDGDRTEFGPTNYYKCD